MLMIETSGSSNAGQYRCYCYSSALSQRPKRKPCACPLSSFKISSAAGTGTKRPDETPRPLEHAADPTVLQPRSQRRSHPLQTQGIPLACAKHRSKAPRSSVRGTSYLLRAPRLLLEMGTEARKPRLSSEGLVILRSYSLVLMPRSQRLRAMSSSRRTSSWCLCRRITCFFGGGGGRFKEQFCCIRVAVTFEEVRRFERLMFGVCVCAPQPEISRHSVSSILHLHPLKPTEP